MRKKFVEALKVNFADLNLTYSVGGQISFDVFPQGWDKVRLLKWACVMINITLQMQTYCLNFIPEGEYDEIHFFGDKTFPGGNDFEIFTHPRVLGHTTTSPDDTKAQCTALFGL